MALRFIIAGAASVLLLFLVLVPRATHDQAPPDPVVIQHGIASFYSDWFQGKPTATGVRHDQNSLTAASRSLPLGSTATVTNLENGRTVQVEVNDRGPYVGGRIIDLSKRAATDIGLSDRKGLARVEVDVQPAAQATPALKHEIAAIGDALSRKADSARNQTAAKATAKTHKPEKTARILAKPGAASSGAKPEPKAEARANANQ